MSEIGICTYNILRTFQISTQLQNVHQPSSIVSTASPQLTTSYIVSAAAQQSNDATISYSSSQHQTTTNTVSANVQTTNNLDQTISCAVPPQRTTAYTVPAPVQQPDNVHKTVTYAVGQPPTAAYNMVASTGGAINNDVIETFSITNVPQQTTVALHNTDALPSAVLQQPNNYMEGIYSQNADGTYSLTEEGETYDLASGIQPQHLLGVLASIVEKQAAMDTAMNAGFKLVLDKLTALESMPRANAVAFSHNITGAMFEPIDSVEKLQEFEENLRKDADFERNAVS